MVAAWQAAARVSDLVRGVVYDYRGRSGVLQAEIFAPRSAPAWTSDREALWNLVETDGRSRRRGRVAVRLGITLPPSLDLAAQRELVDAFVQEHFVTHGRIVDCALHSDRSRDHSSHAHLLVTYRTFGDAMSARVRDDAVTFLSWQRSWDRLCARAQYGALIAHEIERRTPKAALAD